MVLSYKFLNNVKDVNTFDEVEEITLLRGNPSTLYFRLVQTQASTDPSLCENSVQRRYIPAAGSTVTMYFEHIDVCKCFNRTAIQPFPTQDPSIWSIQIMAQDIFQPNSSIIIFTENNVQSRLLAVSDINQKNTGVKRYFI